MTETSIYVVVAAYNEVSRVRSVIDRLLARYPNVVVVDDGSDDGTAAALQGLDICLLRHVINRGQGASLHTGIDFAVAQGADTIVTFDADGQHDVEDISRLVDAVAHGDCDVALGSRFLGTAHDLPLTRRITLKAGVLFTRIVSGVKVSDAHNGIRAFSRKAAQSIDISMDRMAHASEIIDQIKKHGLRMTEVPVSVYYSSYSLQKGQNSWNAFRIALQVFYEKIRR